jgi:hypothetical protein
MTKHWLDVKLRQPQFTVANIKSCSTLWNCSRLTKTTSKELDWEKRAESKIRVRIREITSKGKLLTHNETSN